jgi:hypothetical protein
VHDRSVRLLTGDGVAVADLTRRRKAIVGVGAMAAAVGLAIFDSVRVSQAWRLLGSDAVWATVLGGLGIIATAGLSVWVAHTGGPSACGPSR